MMVWLSSEICQDHILKEKKTEIINILKSFGSSVTLTTKIESPNCNDVKFDLATNIYKTYRKPNDDPVCINKHSNHPLNIKQEIPLSVRSKRSFFQISLYLTTLFHV